MSNTKMTAERLKEIAQQNAQDLSTIQPGYHPYIIRDLLTELRAVQQEMDEARAERESLIADLDYLHHIPVKRQGSLRLLRDERDRLAAEVEKWKDEYANVCKFANDYEAQRDALRAEVERLNNSANMWSKVAQDNKDSMDAWASECKTLRAELADMEDERNELKQRYHPEGVCVPMGTANALRADLAKYKAVADAAKAFRDTLPGADAGVAYRELCAELDVLDAKPGQEGA